VQYFKSTNLRAVFQKHKFTCSISNAQIYVQYFKRTNLRAVFQTHKFTCSISNAQIYVQYFKRTNLRAVFQMHKFTCSISKAQILPRKRTFNVDESGITSFPNKLLKVTAAKGKRLEGKTVSAVFWNLLKTDEIWSATLLSSCQYMKKLSSSTKGRVDTASLMKGIVTSGLYNLRIRPVHMWLLFWLRSSANYCHFLDVQSYLTYLARVHISYFPKICVIL